MGVGIYDINNPDFDENEINKLVKGTPIYILMTWCIDTNPWLIIDGLQDTGENKVLCNIR